MLSVNRVLCVSVPKADTVVGHSMCFLFLCTVEPVVSKYIHM